MLITCHKGYFFEVLPFKIFDKLSGCLKTEELELTLIKKVVLSKKRSIINIKDIKEQCILLDIDEDNSFITHFANILETD